MSSSNKNPRAGNPGLPRRQATRSARAARASESARPGRPTASASQAAALLMILCPRVVQTVRRGLHQPELAGLTLTQQRILRFVGAHPGASLSALAVNFMVSAPSASTTVNRLARLKLLQVHTPAENRRRIALTLTSSGEAIIGRALSIGQQRLGARLASIPPAQLRRMVPFLRTLLQSFQ
ncbi:MAG TPA: MarR family transcriptional regulator [Steroidobacteraceae bacterium]|jgi:DNA-binding MarR family transcriptional regulator|nr:MarR family transcriptional regulator [Steroidobacteraceae bacterium]